MCSPTERKKAELFNQIDTLFQENRFEQAITNLHYLLRTDPSREQDIRFKLAQIFFKRNEIDQTLNILSPLLPSSKRNITELAIQSFISLDEKENSLRILVNSPLHDYEKRKLYQRYFSDSPEGQDNFSIWPQLDIYCPECGDYLFFHQEKIVCLKCHQKEISKFLA